MLFLIVFHIIVSLSWTGVCGWNGSPGYKDAPSKKTDVGGSCPPGFQWNIVDQRCEDIDECGDDTCDQFQDCIDTLDGYECRCKPGFELDSSAESCVDIDECALNQHFCSNGQRCLNLPGSFSCIPDVTTTTAQSPSEDYGSSEYNPEPAFDCDDGYKRHEGHCVDIDECRDGTYVCDDHTDCVNTLGGYECQCMDGFELDSSSGSCVDIDECRDGTYVCDDHTDCVNTLGGHECQCKLGFELDPASGLCVDIDECRDGTHACDDYQDCVNTYGGHKCRCKLGFELDPASGLCVDIDECETGEAPCAYSSDAGSVCKNTRGSYFCYHIDCPPGYKLDAKQRCVRKRSACQLRRRQCSQQPGLYCHKFFTFVANASLPFGKVNFYTMPRPSELWIALFTKVNYELRVVSVQASPGVQPADLSCFKKRVQFNGCVVSLRCSLSGPQVVELELTRSIVGGTTFARSTVVRLFVIISQY